MNVRIASLITIRSGFITSRIEVVARSRRISFIATRLRTRRSTSSNTASLGSGTSSSARANGRAAAISRRSIGNTFSSHQLATSGNDRSRSVSPVGAQSTTIASNSSDSWWRLIWSSENSSSIPGGTVSSSAAIRSTPRSASRSPIHSCTASQWRSISSCACTSWPQRPLPQAVGVLDSSASSESERLWAGSVESTTVRSPAAAQRRAVAAATLVFPTPPLPV